MKKKKEIDRLNALNQRRGQAVERLVTAWWRNHFTGSEQDALEAALRDLAMAHVTMRLGPEFNP